MNYQVISYSLGTAGSGYTNGGPFPCQCNGGGGTGAQANVSVSGGLIQGSIPVLALGSGYSAVCTVNLAPLGAGTGGAVIANLGNGSIASLAVGAAGSGYTSPPNVAITGGGGTGATATANLTATSLASATVTVGGSGYDKNTTVSITGGGGSGATATVQIQGCP